MAGTAAEQAIGLGKPVIQIEGKGPQFTKTFAEAQRRLLGKYVFCATKYKDKNDQINQTIKLIIKTIYLIQLNKKFMISCNENAKKRLGENKACLKMVDDMNIVISTPRNSAPMLSPASPLSKSFLNISTPVQTDFFVSLIPTISISSPTFMTPDSTLPVTTVPRPEIEKTSSTGIKKGLSFGLSG